MKKTYQQPTTLVAVIEMQQIIAASPLGPVEEGHNQNEVPTTDATSGNLSRRRRSVWDDEEEEENGLW